MKSFDKALSILGALALCAGGAFAEDNAGNGKELFAKYCASCHGAHGEVSNEVIPNILGQYPGYVLTSWQLSSRPTPTQPAAASQAI